MKRAEQPSRDTTLSIERTFHQRKSHLAKEWKKNDDEYRRKMLIELLLYYSAIDAFQEL
jgi:hypothetical protein